MILLVDDDDMILRVLPEILMSQGYEVITASGGQDAIDYLVDRTTPNPELVLLDLQMPDVDGNAVLAYIQSVDWESRGGQPTILILTAYPGDIDRDLVSLTKGVYEKPLYGQKLYDVIRQYATKREDRDADDETLKL